MNATLDVSPTDDTFSLHLPFTGDHSNVRFRKKLSEEEEEEMNI